MKKEIAEKWVAALRSGDYTQHRGSLTNPPRTRHCCLGVLCEVAIEEGVELGVSSRWGEYDGENSFLPPCVMEWADIEEIDGRFVRAIDEDVYCLVSMNDIGYSFSQIANAIDSRWEEL